MRPVPFLCGVLRMACGYLPDAQAQGTIGGSDDEPPLIEQVRALGLDSLQRGRATVHFTPGYRDRAERLGAQVDRALEFFADSLGAGLETFHLIMPDREFWKQLAELPPGRLEKRGRSMEGPPLHV